MKELVRAAREFAAEAHTGQERKFVGGPYLAHVEEVANMAAALDLSVGAEAAAWLHDVVEDCEVTQKEIDDRFGIFVGSMVRDLTNTPGASGLSKPERKAKDIERLRYASAEAQSIKCCDIISNVSTVIERAPMFAVTYVPEKWEVLKVLTRAKPAILERADEVMREASARNE